MYSYTFQETRSPKSRCLRDCVFVETWKESDPWSSCLLVLVHLAMDLWCCLVCTTVTSTPSVCLSTLSRLLTKTLPPRQALSPQKFSLDVLTSYTWEDLTRITHHILRFSVGMNFGAGMRLTYCWGLTSDVVCHIQYASIFSIHVGNMLMLLDSG